MVSNLGENIFIEDKVYKNGISYRALELPGYFIDYVAGSSNKKSLVITFESGGDPGRPRPNANRDPWGGKWLLQRGHHVLGIKPKTADWYRGEDLHAFFRSAALKQFFDDFDQVALYGGSMGGFAALTFADAIPGSVVIALDPQSTLDNRLVPWETRFPEGRKQNWGGDFNDARVGAAAAKMVYVAYDPLFEPDRKHVERLTEGNIIHFKMPLVRHGVGMFLQDAGLLSPFAEGALAGTLSASECFRLARGRRNTSRYFGGMAIKSRSTLIKESCFEKIINFDKIILSTHDDLNEIIRSIGNWDLLNSEKFRKVMYDFDDRRLAFCLKGAADAGHADLALDICRMTMARRKVSASFLSLVAECYWKIGLLQDAEAYGRLACLNAPNNGGFHRILARILHSDKRPEEACQISKIAVNLDGSSFLGWWDLAKFSEEAGNIEDAINAADRAFALNPKDRRPNDLSNKLKTEKIK